MNNNKEMHETKIIKPRKTYNAAYYLIGLFFLFLNKINHFLRGYKTPRAFAITEFEKAIEYDFKVVSHWLCFLREYSPAVSSIKDRVILELGPGADLGVGIITLMHGAKKYDSFDVNCLVKSVPDKFYEKLFSHIENIKDKEVDAGALREQLELTRMGKNERINYVCGKDSDLSVFKDEGIDLVFSQAALEHFEDLGNSISLLSKIVKPGAILVAEVDLKTHTRIIRDLDPNNIYRFSDSIYNFFRFPGSPNRLRPHEYVEILEKNGWTDIKIIPLVILEKEYLSKVEPAYNMRFRGRASQMDCLSMMLCATKR